MRQLNGLKILRISLLFGLAMLAIACSSGGKKEAATLESLENRKVKVNPQDLPTANKVDAKKRYQEFAASTSNQELRAVAMERLADIALETKQHEEFREAELKEAEQRARKGGDAVVVDTSKLGDYTSVADQYEKLLKRSPGSKDNEKILYQLARAYDLSGQPEKSLKALTRLMKEFPENPHAEEVQFRRGEIYFSLSDFKNAEHTYGYVLRNKDSPLYERSLYKHGWSLFKLSKLEQSRFSFYKLLDLQFGSGRSYDSFKRSEKELIDDTMRVIGLTFSFEDGVNTLKSFSRKYGARHYEPQIYKELGGQYIRQERFADAANVYASYAEVYPNSREAPLFLVEVIKIYEKGGFPQQLSAAKADLVTRYAISKPYWSRHDRQLLEDVSPYIKSNLDELARHYHAQAQKSKKTSDYRVAAHWYREYVTSFPADAKTPQMNFLLAENLMETGDYLAAATEYERTAYSYAAHKQSAEAGYAALLAHQKILGTLKGNQHTAKRHETVDSALRFAKSFPGDKRTTAVMLKAAEELLELKRGGEASPVAQQVIELEKSKKKPDQQLAASAWAIVATAEFALGNYANAEQASLARLRMKLPDDKERQTHVERLAAAIYKQGELAKAQGQHAQAADYFLRIGQVAPTASIRPNAEYDAAAVYAEAGNWPAAIGVLTGFIRNYPDHKFVPGVTEKLAFAYEQSNDWSAAAVTYDKIYGSEQNPERKKAMLWQMAEFYEKSNDPNNALRIYERYVKEFPEPMDQATEARQKVADIYKTQNNHEQRRYWMTEIIAANERGKPTERTQFLAAKASLELAEPVFQSYRNIHLVQPLKKNLQKKKTAMKDVIDAYTKAANYGVAEVTTASTYRIAEIYNDFSRGLFASERPKGLSTTELEQYDLLLEEQAYPFEEKAIEIHEANADRVKTGVYDEWVKKSLIELRKLRPVRYAKLERSELFDVAIE
ncbi:MAG TPA: tetratricopeptide repeat protein [Gammaproteobacteria bacterium]